MGNENTKTKMEDTLRELLKAQGIAVKKVTARTFLDVVERHAPWFLEEGLLNIPQWDHLKVSLQTAENEEQLPVGVMSVWQLVRQALLSPTERGKESLDRGSEQLEEVKEERSKASVISEAVEEEEGEELSGEELARKLKEMGLKGATAPPDEFDDESYRPPPYVPATYPRQRRLRWDVSITPNFFPVYEDQNQQRYHQAFEFKLVKQLKDAVSQYGPQSAFTQSMIATLAENYLTPKDWCDITKAVLTGGQYLTWKAAYQEHCVEMARHNAQNDRAQWNTEMLMGTGQYEGHHNQIQFPPAVYIQIGRCAEKAWRMITGAGDLQGQLSKVIQGTNEPYADFVDRLMQTASRVFGDVNQAMPLVKQLAYEQANKYCKEAIRPWRNKDLSSWIKLCRDINDITIQGQVLANAIVSGFKSTERGRKCFNCGSLQHLRKWSRWISI